MGIFDALTAAANHLGLVRVVEVKNAAKPQKLTTRAVTLEELTKDIRTEQVRALSEKPAELSLDLEKVFEAAGVKPPAHGWTIPRLQQLVETQQYQAMPRESAQQAILGLLATEKAPVEELVQEAIQRDKALDAFESFVFEKMKQRVQVRQSNSAQIEQQIQALREEQSRLAAQTRIDQEHWADWHQRKTAVEEQMAQALSYLLEKPIVTIDRDPHPLPG